MDAAAAAETPAWVLIVLALITTASSVIAAWISNRTKRANSSDHGEVVKRLDALTNQITSMKVSVDELVAWRQRFSGSAFPDANAISTWVQKITDMEHILKTHVEWEETESEKYHEVATTINDLKDALNRLSVLNNIGEPFVGGEYDPNRSAQDSTHGQQESSLSVRGDRSDSALGGTAHLK